MFKRKLFKRILPAILSVAMMFQSLPATAMAAEYEEPETVVESVTDDEETDSDVEDTQEEESVSVSEVQEEADTDSNHDNDNTVSDSNNESEAETENTQGAVSEETQTPAVEADEIVDVAVGESNETASIGITKLVIDREKLKSVIPNGYYDTTSGNWVDFSALSYEEKSNTVTANYDKDESDIFGDILKYIKNNGIVTIESDNEDKTEDLKSHIEYKWQKKNSEGEYIDIEGGTFPKNFGDYKLVISFAGIEEAYNAAESQEILFRIDKCKVTVNYNGSDTVVPGTTVADVKKNVRENYTLKLGTQTITDKERIKLLYVEETEDNPRIVIRDAHTKEDLGDTVILNSTNDYTMEFFVSLKTEDKENYDEVSDSLVNIKFTDAIQTIISVTLIDDLKDGVVDAIAKVYDTKSIDVETEITPFFNAVINVDEDGDGEIDVDENEKEITVDGKFTYKWLDANENEINASDVKDAGTYYYQLIYEGEKGHYQDAEAKIKVVIEAADAAVKPVVSDSTVFYEGMTVEEVLKTVTGSEVYEINDGVVASTKLSDAIVDEYFWGVYYNLDNNTTQSYEPVFVVEQRVKTTEAEDAKVEWSEWSEQNNDDQLQDDDSYEYRIRFSGRKSVYNSKGVEIHTVDINASEGNYKVDLSDKILDSCAKIITISKSTELEIDISKMLQDGQGAEFTNPITKEYDGSEIFSASDTRNKYKVASVSGGSGELKYTWQYLTGYRTVYDEEGNASQEPQWEDYDYYGYTPNVENRLTPSNAGNYRIAVSYHDDTNKTHAATKYVYHTITKKNVQIQLSSEEGKPSVYAGTTVSEFLSDIYSQVSHSIVKGTVAADETSETGYRFQADTENAQLNWLRTYNYNLEWYVERKIQAGANAGTYEKVNGYDVFYAGEEYRLGVNFTYYPDTNYNNRYALDNNNNVIKNEDGTDKIAYENEIIDVFPVQSQGIEINIDVDWSKVTDTVKTYDGVSLNMEQIKNAITVTRAKDGSVIPEAEYPDIIYSWFYEEDGETVGENAAIHAGNYYLNLSVEQNEVYARYSKTYDGENDKLFIINQRDLTITPNLNSEIKAGTYIYNNNVKALCADAPIVEGWAPGTFEEAFYSSDEYKVYVYEDDTFAVPYIVSGLKLNVYDADGLFRGYLRGDGRVYNAAYTGSLRGLTSSATDYFKRDYNLIFNKVEMVPVRAVSFVESDNYGNTAATRLYDEISKNSAGDWKHTITPREGIVYTTNAYYDKNQEKYVSGNYFVVKITAPLEFSDESGAAANVVYKNSIEGENANGYLLEEGTSGNRAELMIAFDANDGQTTKTFEIIWENGYSEEFVVDFTNCTLGDDFTKAVAPKSLAFNGASAKMVVGETQQLDLKITKNQMSDIICIKYESSDPSVLNVSETGYVTALSAGTKTATATITARPAYEKDGKKVPIEGTKVKTATVKITVSNVAAVKGIKATPYDTKADLIYTVPAGSKADSKNGYRREIYVLEGKGIKADVFESEIAKVSNGNYDAFAAAPVFTTKLPTVLDPVTITGLMPDTEYTVYVRNVSQLRTMEDGNQVAESHAGAVASFKTIKAQTIGLTAYFKDKDDETNKLHSGYVEFSGKNKVQLYVDARYYQKYDVDKNYSDDLDYVTYTLPLSKDQQKSYVNPNLTYYVIDDLDGFRIDEDNTAHFDTAYQSKIATIDKKGLITLKGVGHVYAIAWDKQSNKVGYACLQIEADANGLTASNIKMKAGNSVYLTDYLTYKQGSTKLIGYCDYYENDYCYNDYDYDASHKMTPLQNLSIDLKSDDNFDIEPIWYYGQIVDYKITAKTSSGTITATVTDKTINQSATVKIQTSAIDAVKNLKTRDVVDKFAYITFNYSANNDFEERADGRKLAFRIVVKDSTGKIMSDELKLPEELYFVRSNNYDGWRYINELNQYYSDTNAHAWSNWYADAKHTMYQFEYPVTGLTRLSNYTVSVTAVYGNYPSDIITSKEAGAKIKTTNIPASYANLNDDYVNNSNVEVFVKDGKVMPLADYPTLKSGNTYTLSLSLDNDFDNPDAKLMKTDTVTWKSSNAKVASVKVKAGTYTAELKAVGKGSTDITVTSKITKKVIAKWTVWVNAVGEADGYYGDNIDDESATFDNLEVLGADVLTLNNSLRYTLKKGESKWVVFTAPEYGRYTVSASADFFVYTNDLNLNRVVRNGYQTSSYNNNNNPMEKNSTYYFYVYNSDRSSKTVTITASGYEYVTISNGTTVKGGSHVTFVAPEDNYYTFRFKKDGEIVSETSRSLSKGERVFNITVPGTAKSEYEVEISSRQPQKLEKGVDTDSITLQKDVENWYSFTADETGMYSIYTKEANKAVTAQLFTDIKAATSTVNAAALKDADGKDTNNVEFAVRKLEKGDTVYIRLMSGSEEEAAAKLRVDMVNKTVTTTNPAEVVIDKDGGTQYVTFEAPEDGNYAVTISYGKMTDESGNEIIPRVSINESKDSSTVTISSEPLEKVYDYSGSKALEKGDLITYTITSNKKDTRVTVKAEATGADVEVAADGDAQTVDVSSKISRWMTFTALKDGWYDFNFTVAKSANAGSETEAVKPEITATIYQSNKTSVVRTISGTEDGFTPYSVYLRAGTIRAIQLTSDTADLTSVSLSVKDTSAKLLNDSETITLGKGESVRYYWTAKKEGIYDFTLKTISEQGSVSVYKADQASGNGTYSSFDSLSGYMANGETVYLKFTAGSDADVTFTTDITGKTVEKLVADTDFTVAAGETKLVEFTPKKTALYDYSVSGSRYEILLLDSLDSEGVTYNFTQSKYCNAGVKQLFKVTNKNAKSTLEDAAEAAKEDDANKVTLRVSEVKPEEITLTNAGTATLKSGERKWFQFKAESDRTEKYDFTATAKNGDDSRSLTIYYTADLSKSTRRYNDSIALKNGEYVYLYVTAPVEYTYDEEGRQTAVDFTVTLAVSKVSGTQLTEGKEEEIALTKDNAVQYLEFTASEDGIYTFSAEEVKAADENVSAQAQTFTVAYYKNSGNYVTLYYDTSFSIALEKGDRIVIRLTSSSDEDQKVKVVIRKEAITSLGSDAVDTGDIKLGEYKLFSVKSGEKCRYFVETLDVPAGVTLGADRVDSDGNNASMNGLSYYMGVTSGSGIYFSYVGAVGSEEVFKITYESYTPENAEAEQTKETVNFKIRTGVVDDEIESLNTGDTKDIKLDAKHVKWYRFTPSEEGRYVIKAGSSDALVRVFTSDIASTSGSINQTPYTYNVDKSQVGKEIVYAVLNNNAAKANEFKVNLYKVVPQELTEASPVTVDVATYEENERIWIHFTAPSDGRYIFTNDSVVSLRYDSYGKFYFDGWNREICMNEGQEILLAAYYDEKPSEQTSFRISVSSVKPETISVSEQGTEVVFGINDANGKWIAFTAPETAKYTFAMTSQSETGASLYRVERYSKLNASWYDERISDTSAYTYGMNKGQTVYFKLTPSGLSSETDQLTVTVKITQDIVLTQLTLTDNAISEIAAGTEKWAYFTANEAGFYKFELKGGLRVERFFDLNRNYDTVYTRDGDSFEIPLEKDETVYFRVENRTGETAAENIVLTKTVEIKELSVGASDSVSLPESGKAWYVVNFTEDGYYSISADTKFRVYASLSDGSYLTYTSSYVAEFTKGEVRYILVEGTAGSDVTVSCAKVRQEELNGAGSVNLELAKGEVVIVNWYAEEDGGYYNLGFSADKQVSYKAYYYYYDEYDYSIFDQNPNSNGKTWELAPGGNESDWERCILIEAKYDGTKVKVSSVKTKPNLSIYSSRWIELLGGQTETFDFTVPYDGDYIFRSMEGSYLSAELRDASGRLLGSDDAGSEERNIYIFAEGLAAGQKLTFTVKNMSSDDCWPGIAVSRCIKKDVTLGENTISSETFNVESRQEAWITYTVTKSGYYEFSSNYTTMCLYDASGNYLDERYYEAGDEGFGIIDSIWLTAGTEVMLQTYYVNHNAGTYTVTAALSGNKGSYWNTSYDSNWNTSASAGSDASVIVYLMGAGTYTFSAYDVNDGEYGTIALYDGSSEYPRQTGTRITYESNGFSAVRLKVSGADNKAFTGYVSCSKVYEHDTYNVTMTNDSYSRQVSVSDGKEAWFEFTVEKAGSYNFYSTANDGCDNYAELYVNGGQYTSDNDANGNGQFRISYNLSAGDRVSLRTYTYGHGSGTSTYTVTIEYGGAAVANYSWNISSSSSTSSKNLSLGSGYEAAISLTLSAKGTYRFYAGENQEDVVITLYVNGEAGESGSSVTYEYDPSKNESVTLRVRNGEDYQRFYGYIYVDFEVAHETYSLSMDSSQTVEISGGTEAWFTYTAQEAGIYSFHVEDGNENGVSNSVYAYMYVNDVSVKNTNGRSFALPYYLDAGDEMVVKAYHYNHNSSYSGKYEVTLTYGPLATTDSTWSISSTTTDSRSVYANEYYERIIPLQLSYKGTYQFYFDTTSYPDLVVALYENGEEIRSGSSIEYEYHPNADSEVSLELRVHNGDRYQYFSYVTLYETFSYWHDDYMLTVQDIDSDAIESMDVEISGGTEAWFTYTADQAGVYNFNVAEGSENNDSDILYAYMYLNDDYDTSVKNTYTYNNEFTLSYYLNAGDKIVVKTYHSNHSILYSGKYAVTFTYGAETMSNSDTWSVSSGTSLPVSKNLSISEYKQVVITVTLPEDGTYQFSSPYNEKNIIFELYETDGGEETEITKSDAPGAPITYTYNSSDSKAITLKVHRDNYQYFNGSIYLSKVYSDDEKSNDTLSLSDSDTDNTKTVSLDAGKEVWLTFNDIWEAGFYKFSLTNTTSTIKTEIYVNDGYYSSSTSTSYELFLAADDVVLLKTYVNGHNNTNAVSYDIKAEYTGIKSTNNSWNISYLNSNYYASKWISADDGYEINIPLTFSSSNLSTEGLFKFYNYTGTEDLTFELWKSSSEEGSSPELIDLGSSVKYQYDPDSVSDETMTLKVYNVGYRKFSGQTIYAAFCLNEYELTLDNPSQETTVSGGYEAWFEFTAPESGTYSFYATTAESCDNYAELYVNDKYCVSDDDSNSNAQFRIRYDLNAGDTAWLKTYRYNHGTDEITYTVHIEKEL